MNNLDFIKTVDTPLPQVLRKRPDGGFRKHPSSFFKQLCIGKFPSPDLQDIAQVLKVSIKTLELFLSADVAVDTNLASKLEEGTDVDAATWLELQRQYDCYKNN